MANPKTALEPGCYYHIYNRGINGCELFREPTNYEYFLGLYEKHISPVAETFAWCLMGNHFHLLVKIKEVAFFSSSSSSHLEGFKNLRGVVDDAKKTATFVYQNKFFKIWNSAQKWFCYASVFSLKPLCFKTFRSLRCTSYQHITLKEYKSIHY